MYDGGVVQVRVASEGVVGIVDGVTSESQPGQNVIRPGVANKKQTVARVGDSMWEL